MAEEAKGDPFPPSSADEDSGGERVFEIRTREDKTKETAAPLPQARSPTSDSWSVSSSITPFGVRTSSVSALDGYYRPPINAALVLLSPRFDTPDARELVRSTLLRRMKGGSARIAVDRSIPAGTVNRLKLVDYMYGEAARLAMEAEPSELRGKMVESAFEKAFNEKWSSALSTDKVTNALRALTRLGCDPKRLSEAWREAEDRTPKPGVARLGPDLLCGLLSVGEKSLYVLNGFYPGVRGRCISPGSAFHAFGVEWDPTNATSWAFFRENISGAAPPADRRLALLAGRGGSTRSARPAAPCGKSCGNAAPTELGIDEQSLEDDYDGWDDVFYVASSPLEALADRCAWLLGGDPRDGTSSSLSNDIPYGRVVLGRGIPEWKLVQWFENPLVLVPPPPPPSFSDGSLEKKRIFDVVRGLNSEDCTKKLLDIYDFELRGLETSGTGCSCVIS
eukprot:CAMPEP_0113577648 /NCGR_PEP_ID=MMETSP0015_2-20120614/29002_1 /TAXON_ID=2838 /ORGANISM="Odontella" /LENGTH=449 /DNA_ID=CAMNT_0000481285 /DNA_START=18 /DNA_END=1368 /DNA_ORIENTATION=+ /assembly_acc=CAM_ASM_000160